VEAYAEWPISHSERYYYKPSSVVIKGRHSCRWAEKWVFAERGQNRGWDRGSEEADWCFKTPDAPNYDEGSII